MGMNSSQPLGSLRFQSAGSGLPTHTAAKLEMLLASIFVLLLTVVIKRRFFSPLSDIPGPCLASVTRLWHVSRIIRGRVSQDTLDLHDRHGPFVRIAPDEVSVSHPEAPRKLLLQPLHKGSWYKVAAIPDWRFQTPLSSTDPKQKIARAKAFAPGYTFSSMIQTEEHIDRTVEKLLAWMDSSAAARRPMELDLFFSFAAFDIIGEVFFSRPFGFIDKGGDIDGTLHVGQAANALAAVAGYLGVLRHVVANPITSELGLLPTGFLVKTAMSALAERKKNPDSRFDVVAHWLRMLQEHPERLTLEDLHANLVTNVGAGSDAISCSLQSFVYYMARSPDRWARCRAEIEDARARQGRCRGAVISYEDCKSLAYFQACLKEALRLFSAQGLGLQRVAPPGGITLGDRTFPEGTILSIHAKTMQLDTSIWGPDAREFNPERWFADDAAAIEKYWLVFGLGYAACPGQNLAKIELSKILSTIVRDYDIRLVNPEREWDYRAYFATLPSQWPVFIQKHV